MALSGARPAAHPFSVSYAQIAIGDRSFSAIVRLPLDDVDLLLRLDRDLDGRVSGAELEMAAAAVRLYLGKHIRIIANGMPLSEAVERVALWHDASKFPFIEGSLSYEAARAIEQ